MWLHYQGANQIDYHIGGAVMACQLRQFIPHAPAWQHLPQVLTLSLIALLLPLLGEKANLPVVHVVIHKQQQKLVCPWAICQLRLHNRQRKPPCLLQKARVL